MSHARRSAAISASSLTWRNDSTTRSAGTSDAPVASSPSRAWESTLSSVRLDRPGAVGDELCGSAEQVAADAVLDVGQLGRRLVAIAPVGQEHRSTVTRHDECTVGAGEPGQVADVDQRRDDDPVELALGEQGGEALAARGGAHDEMAR